MENTGNRRLLFAVGGVLFFAVIVIVWYFSYVNPITAQSLNETNNPLPVKSFPARFQFLNWGNNDVGTTTTEITDPLKEPLVEVWNKAATGQAFITTQSLKEVVGTTTQGTSTTVIDIKKTVRATSTTIIFVDRVTGYIYGYPLTTGKVFQISNTVIPGVHDAYFFNNGTRVIMRYADRERNVVMGLIGTVPSVSEGGTPSPLEKVQYLTSEVVSVAINGRKDTASYVVATEKGSAVYSLGSKEPSLVASSPFREWDLSYGGDSLFVTTKPSAYVSGATFSLPLFQSESDERTGLMSNPSDGGILLNSMWSNKGLTTFFSKDGKLQRLPLLTLAPKCSWGEKNFLVCAIPRMIPRVAEGLPDDWFQGRVSFADDLVIVDTSTGTGFPLYTFSEKEGLFDITGITMNDDNEIFSFTRKQNGSLWLLNTKNNKGE